MGGGQPGEGGRLLAVSDLHVRYADNRDVVDRLRPAHADDWLIVAGDVAERVADIARVLALLADRFARVVWTPGNHELWTTGRGDVPLRGEARYRHLVDVARGLGVVTPEDPYPVWDGAGGPAVVAPVFALYDYTFLPAGAPDTAAALALAWERGVVCTDEMF
ncbi:MAG TPA: metallophosphoesterase, partial [Pilimelia sp.]|nr:metallophosphoesterase [Pilimelia sp.]